MATYENDKKPSKAAQDSDADNKLARDWMDELSEWQETDRDQRDQAIECDDFLLKKDGQWEPKQIAILDGANRPRMTYDKITPVIEAKMADVEDMDFGSNVKPLDGGATKETALVYDGIVRNILSRSNASDLYRNAIRRLMRRGFDAFIVRSEYTDEYAFDQQLVVDWIPNSINRVWTSSTCTESTSEDTSAAYVLSSMSIADYEERWPEGKKVSVNTSPNDSNQDRNDFQPDVITVAERYYAKPGTIDVVLMSDGKVYRDDDKFSMVQRELKDKGITEEKRKTVDDYKWCYRVFDGGGMLGEVMLTPFISCPVVTVYGNYEIVGENSKITYSGDVLRQMDAQRTHNSAKSRELEEGALSPRTKIWMTRKQAKGESEAIGRMNISNDPVQFFTPDPEAPQPYQIGGPQANQHLNILATEMSNDIKEHAGVFSAMQGQQQGRQSEDAIRMQIDRGTAGTRKWVNSLVRGNKRICEILVETIPRVIDTRREVMTTAIDGTEEMQAVNDEVFDEESQQMVKLNDLTAGKFGVVCEAGPAFTNRMEAGLEALLRYAAVDPAIVQQAGDVMLKAIDAPMVDQIAERKRAQMLQVGLIPVDQMTDEEKQMVEQMAQQPQQPDLAQMEGQARMMEGQAALQNEQNDAQKLQFDVAKAQASNQVDLQELELKRLKLMIDAQRMEQELGIKSAVTQADIAKTQADIGKVNADTMKSKVDAAATMAGAMAEPEETETVLVYDTKTGGFQRG